MSSPFDFSDFGSPPTPTVNSTRLRPSGGLQSATPDLGLLTKFDPFADAQPRHTQPDDAFSAIAPGLARGLTVARPPLSLLGLAFALAAAGLVVAGVWGGALTAAAAGWFLAGPTAIGLLGVYTRVDTGRRTNAVYSAPSWSCAVYWSLVLVAMAGIGVGAWRLAIWAGTQ